MSGSRQTRRVVSGLSAFDPGRPRSSWAMGLPVLLVATALAVAPVAAADDDRGFHVDYDPDTREVHLSWPSDRQGGQYAVYRDGQLVHTSSDTQYSEVLEADPVTGLVRAHYVVTAVTTVLFGSDAGLPCNTGPLPSGQEGPGPDCMGINIGGQTSASTQTHELLGSALIGHQTGSNGMCEAILIAFKPNQYPYVFTAINHACIDGVMRLIDGVIDLILEPTDGLPIQSW